MEKEYDEYDGLRYELFEVLLPRMVYRGTEKERDEFLGILNQDGGTLVRDMYRRMCMGDGLQDPGERAAFEVEAFERGGVDILQVILPPYNPNIADIVRAYFLSANCGSKRETVRYFVIKRFRDGSFFILYISPKLEKLLGEELTVHIGDMEYEYWRLVSEYAGTLI